MRSWFLIITLFSSIEFLANLPFLEIFLAIVPSCLNNIKVSSIITNRVACCFESPLFSMAQCFLILICSAIFSKTSSNDCSNILCNSADNALLSISKYPVAEIRKQIADLILKRFSNMVELFKLYFNIYLSRTSLCWFLKIVLIFGHKRKKSQLFLKKLKG